jgi:para-nitrobenzyl esterase
MGLRKTGLAAAICCALAGGATAAPVATANGPVEGVARNGVEQFLGIPFAAPPVGPLRWKPPQPVKPWTAIRSAKAFGPTCAQVTTLGPFAGPPNSNEDCLYLNVFTPDVPLKGKPGAKLPVLVWIHGGGYFDGASNDYDASRLAAQGKLVVVTINYRLNLFGFLSHPALDNQGAPFGNYGLMDMQAALQWVRANIASFGGDAQNVTLGGQSAGAGAAAAHVISPGSAGLFHRAIFQSGGYSPIAPLTAARERGIKFAEAAGCPKSEKTGNNTQIAQCLRALPAAKIAALSGSESATSVFVSGPMIDGTVIPRQAIDAFEEGRFTRMPIMMGTTRDEGNFTAGIAQYFKKDRSAITQEEFGDYVRRTYGGHAGPGGTPPAYPKDAVAALIKHYTGAMPHQNWARLHGDMLACRGLYVAGAIAKHAPLYMYRFDDRTAPSYFPKMAGFTPGAYHTGDIPYVFIGYHGGPDGVRVPLTPIQTGLSDKMIAAWAGFARSGNPNAKGDAPWPRWQAGATHPAYFLQDNAWKQTLTNAQFAAAHNCGFWNSILLYK